MGNFVRHSSGSQVLSNLNPDLQGLNPNTHLCVDVKTFLRQERIAKLNKPYQGVLTRDGEEHFNFVETSSPTLGKRNPRIYDGKCITVTLWEDGSRHLNFKQRALGKDFCCEAARELLALGGLVESK